MMSGFEPLEQRCLLAMDSALYSQASPDWFAATLVAPAATDGAVTNAANTSSGNAATSEWLVRLSASALDNIHSVAAAASTIDKSNLGLSVVRGLGLPGQLLVRATAATDDVQKYLSSLTTLAYYEPNQKIHIDATPNDASYGTLWGMNNSGQRSGTADADIDAPEAWDISTGNRSNVVAVIDTGIDYTHPDLAANAWTNPGEIPGNGIDDDGNGFIDDVHGYDFVNNDGDPMDDHDHGTHCSGTIGGVGNNGIGVVGVNWVATIMGLKFLDSSGSGSDSDAIRAVNYATMMKGRGVNIRVTSNSWGGGGFDQSLLDAINAGGAANILFVAAAGNSGVNTDSSPEYPAAYNTPYILSVAATDRNDALASFSNYGATTVDLGAPGVSILSTIPNNSYATFSGTSMATPHVSGVAALALSVDPSLTVAQLKSALMNNTDPISALAGKSVTGGRLNAQKVLNSLGLTVLNTTPTIGSVVSTAPTSFVVDFNQAYTPGSVNISDFTVNGTPATGYTLTDADTITFVFGPSPVTTQGLQTMSIAAGALTRLSDGSPNTAFSAQFRYDVLPLQVSSTLPANASIVAPPLTTLTLNFNEAIDPASLGTNDLSLSQGSVVSFLALNSTTVQYTLSGLTAEGTLDFDVPAGAITDTFGNPGLAYSASVTLDSGTVALPAFAQRAPAGSLVYETSASAAIGYTGDTDSFTVTLDAGQSLSLVAAPGIAGLRPSVQLTGPATNVSATAAAAGANVVLQTIGIAAAGTYTITVSGANNTTGAYSLRAELNAAVENETFASGTSNDTIATAQDISATSFVLPAGASRLAVVGRTDAPGMGTPTTVNSTDVPKTIADVATTDSTLTVGTHTTIADLNVQISLTHTYDSDLVISLISPLGTTITLASHNGSSGDNFTNTVFDDEAATPISSGSAPFTGSFRPFQALSGFDTQDAFGTWTLRIQDTAAIDTGTLLSWSITTQTATPKPDVYSFNLATGQVVSLQMLTASASSATVELLNSIGTVVSSGTSGATNVTSSITNYAAPAAGTYYARVNHNAILDYNLVVERQAAFDLEANDSFATARDISGADGALGFITSANSDYFQFFVSSGNVVTLTTTTPGDATPGLFNNTLDPILTAFAPDGSQVATNDNGAGDGRNAQIVFTATQSGQFRARVSSAATSGEYYLQVVGAGAPNSPPSVASTVPTTGQFVTVFPTTYRINFSEAIDSTTVQATDLAIGGLTATSVTFIDSDTIDFGINPLALAGDGAYSVVLAAGVLNDLQGQPNLAFNGTFTLDTGAPRVTSTTFNGGALPSDHVLPVGTLTFTAGFSEALATPDANDIRLTETNSGQTYGANSVTYDGANHRFTAAYTSQLPEGNYALTLVSGNGAFEDLAGFDLDGEAGPGNDGTPSGNGVAGGDFVVNFQVDTATAAFPTLTAVNPQGSLIYDPSASFVISSATDVDRFTINLDAGQTLTAVVEPTGSSLRPVITLKDPANNTIGTVTSATAGANVVLSPTAVTTSGTYTIELSGASGSVGSAALELFLNAAVEQERYTAAANNTVGTAQNIDNSSLALNAVATRVAVVGRTENSTADVYSFALTAGRNVTLVVGGGAGLTLELLDAGSNVLATGVSTATNVAQVISGFAPSTSGNYFARITGPALSVYSLVVTRGAAFDLEPNDTLASAEAFGNDITALGYIGAADHDYYSFLLSVGQSLQVSTATPADGNGQFFNTLDPVLELYDPGGTLVATDDNSADGRNALLNATALTSGVYKVHISAIAGTTGEYIVQAQTGIPNVAPTATYEDTLSSGGLSVTPNADSPGGTAFFKITHITAGSLFKQDGVTTVNDGSFITLADGAAGLRFLPTLNSNDAGSFQAQASLTSGDAGLGGGVALATISVLAVNDAPLLDNSGSPRLADVLKNDINSSGSLIGEILARGAGGNPISDVDSGALRGIAVTAAETNHGSWQYSLNGGTTWNPLSAVNQTSSRLLADNSNTRLRFVPAAGFESGLFNSILPKITFRAWDQTSGVNGDLVNTTVTGNSTAFSTATETATVRITNPWFTVNGNSLSIQGTSGADIVLIQQLSASSIQVGINGNYQTVPTAQITGFTADGAGGNDTLYGIFNIGTAEDLTFSAGGLSVSGTFTATASNFNSVIVYGDNSDLQTFTGSANDDIYYAYPNGAIITMGSQLAIGVGIMQSTVNDSVGHDVAVLVGSTGNDTLTATSSQTTFVGPGYAHTLSGWKHIYAFGVSGNDSAQLSDDPTNDEFHALSSFSVLLGPRPTGVATFLLEAIGFASVKAFASAGGTDLAVLYDTTGDETFSGNDTLSALSNSAFKVEAEAFDYVYGLATSGGNDTATINGSTGNDYLFASGPLAQYYSYNNGAFIQLYYFDTVTAVSNGGSDGLHRVDPVDYVLTLQGSWASV